jgi:HEAT repeat protein
LATLVSLITDLRTTPEARNFLLRDLLSTNSETTVPALVEIMGTCSQETVLTSVCEALADLDQPDPALIDPLLALIEQHEGSVRRAAAEALAAYHGKEAASAVGRFVLDRSHAYAARLAAMEVLAELPEPPESVDALIEALDDPRAGIRSAAHEFLLRMGLQDLGPEAAAWRGYWAEHRDNSPVDRLRSILRDKKRRLRDSEQARAAAAARNLELLREIYDRCNEGEKTEQIVSLLGDGQAGVRMLGIELVNAMIADRKDVPAEVLDPLRSLVGDPVPQVRAKAVPVLRDLRIPSDVDVLLSALGRESEEPVLRELLNALGRYGDARAIEQLIPYLSRDYPPAIVGEAAEALGLLLGTVRSATSQGDSTSTAKAAKALLERFESTPEEQADLRERILQAMSKTADPSFGPSFLAHIDSPRSGMKSAAIQGLAALGDSAHAAALVPHLADANAQVRQISAQALGLLGGKQEHLEALLGRLDPEVEPIEAVRATVWEAFVKLFRKQEPAVQLRWADRLAPQNQNAAASNERFVRLLVEIEKALAGTQNEVALVAEVRIRLAEAYADLGRHADAVGKYQQVYEWFREQPKDRLRRVGAKMLNSQLMTGRLNLAADHLALLLCDATEQEQGPLRSVVLGFLRDRLAQGEFDDVLALTDKLLESETVPLAPGFRDEVQSLHRQALDRRELHHRQQVAEWVKLLGGPPSEADDARRRILDLGPGAVTGLAAALRDLLDAPEHDAALEGELVNLLRQVRPNWPGFEPDAPLEQKRNALENLTAKEQPSASP